MTPLRRNRRQRRADQVVRRQEERAELVHACACATSARQAGVPDTVDLGVGILFFHDLHRALGEVSCPRCPECTALRREGVIDRVRQPRSAVLSVWQRLLAAKLEELERQGEGEGDHG